MDSVRLPPLDYTNLATVLGACVRIGSSSGLGVHLWGQRLPPKGLCALLGVERWNGSAGAGDGRAARWGGMTLHLHYCCLSMPAPR